MEEPPPPLLYPIANTPLVEFPAAELRYDAQEADKDVVIAIVSVE